MSSLWRKFTAKAGVALPFLHRPVETGIGCIVAADCTLGKQVRIQRWTRLYGCSVADHVVIGARVYCHATNIDSYSALGGDIWMDQVRIGRFCSIGPRCFAGFGEHPTHMISTSPVFYSTRRQCGVSFSDADYFEETKGIEIGHDVWIGADVFIRNGVRIGHGAIVAAGAKVMANVEDYAIVGGVPAKLIRYRYPEEERRQLLALRWWDWTPAELTAAAALFRAGNVEDLITWSRRGKPV